MAQTEKHKKPTGRSAVGKKQNPEGKKVYW